MFLLILLIFGIHLRNTSHNHVIAVAIGDILVTLEVLLILPLVLRINFFDDRYFLFGIADVEVAGSLISIIANLPYIVLFIIVASSQNVHLLLLLDLVLLRDGQLRLRVLGNVALVYDADVGSACVLAFFNLGILLTGVNSSDLLGCTE